MKKQAQGARRKAKQIGLQSVGARSAVVETMSGQALRAHDRMCIYDIQGGLI
jgi:hypothetical protein